MIADIPRERFLDPATTAMVGDRRFDIAGAQADGIRAIGVLRGYGSRRELTEAGAGLLIAETRELDMRTIARALGGGLDPQGAVPS